MMDYTTGFSNGDLKCKNFLECELAMLSETRKCKEIVAWSGDFGLDQYISWNLSSEDLTLEVICKKILKNFASHRQMN